MNPNIGGVKMAKIVRFDELGGPQVLKIKEEKTKVVISAP
jgi:hypothetical protein